MTECEKLFSEAIQRKLKTKIKGRIFVCITYGDELLVKIYENNNILFQSLKPNASEAIRNGLKSNDVVYDILDQFKDYIHTKADCKYFYNS